MKHHLPILMLACIFSACAPQEKQPVVAASQWLNPAHLNHLYEEVKMGNDTVGAIWIYCEAPDYHHVGDEDEGFTCVDDVARALVFYCRFYQEKPSPEVLRKIKSLTAFVLHMQAENGFFHNFLLPGGQINTTHQNSTAIASWWSWRALWGLSEVGLLRNAELADLQKQVKPAMNILVKNMQGVCPSSHDTIVYDGVVLPKCLGECGADQTSVMLLGLANFYQTNPSDSLKNLLLSLGDQLLMMQKGGEAVLPFSAFLSWRNNWHGWGNTQAYALLRAGKVLQHQPFIEAGLNEVRNFYPEVLKLGFLREFKLTKTDSLFSMQDVKQLPQIAYDISPMVLASATAFELTQDTIFAKQTGQLATWFFGNNPAKKPMYDPATGRCLDGINSPTELNQNSGAESTIEALLALQAVEKMPGAKNELEGYLKNK